MNRLANITTIA